MDLSEGASLNVTGFLLWVQRVEILPSSQIHMSLCHCSSVGTAQSRSLPTSMRRCHRPLRVVCWASHLTFICLCILEIICLYILENRGSGSSYRCRRYRQTDLSTGGSFVNKAAFSRFLFTIVGAPGLTMGYTPASNGELLPNIEAFEWRPFWVQCPQNSTEHCLNTCRRGPVRRSLSHTATGNQDGIVQIWDSRNWSERILLCIDLILPFRPDLCIWKHFSKEALLR